MSRMTLAKHLDGERGTAADWLRKACWYLEGTRSYQMALAADDVRQYALRHWTGRDIYSLMERATPELRNELLIAWQQTEAALDEVAVLRAELGRKP